MAFLFCKKYISFLAFFLALSLACVAKSQEPVPASDPGVVGEPSEIFDVDESEIQSQNNIDDFSEISSEISDEFDDFDLDINSFSDELLDVEPELQNVEPINQNGDVIGVSEGQTPQTNISDVEEDYIPPKIEKQNDDAKSQDVPTALDSKNIEAVKNANSKNTEEQEKYRKLKVHLTNFLRVFNNKDAELLPLEPKKEVELAEQQNEVEKIDSLPEEVVVQDTDNNAEQPLQEAASQSAEQVVDEVMQEQEVADAAPEEVEEVEEVAEAKKVEPEKQKTVFENPSMDDDEIEELLKIDSEKIQEPVEIVQEQPSHPEKTEEVKEIVETIKPVEPSKNIAQQEKEVKEEQVVSEQKQEMPKAKEQSEPEQKIVKTKPAKIEKPIVISEKDSKFLEKMEKKGDALPPNKKMSATSEETLQKVSAPLAREAQEKLNAKAPTKIAVDRSEKNQTKTFGIDDENSAEYSLSFKDQTDGGTKINVAKTMDSAYRALMLGQVSASIELYKDVLDAEPDNKNAKLGLATAYHKNYQVDQARDIYTSILKDEPDNKEALNNFLVLVAEEAPEDALYELKKLERLNSQFSPVPAQIAMIYLKLKKYDKAERYLRRAVILSPDNITYKYNLAIISDRLKKYPQAIRVYKQVLAQAEKGAAIPGSTDQLIERLNFLEKKVR